MSTLLDAPIDAYEAVRVFVERGGDVLLIIMAIIFAMWALIVERFVYFRFGYRELAQRIQNRWDGRAERQSWEAHEIRQSMIAEAGMNLQQSLPLIKALIAVCPLAGLLGTVTGMMEVFDVMALVGTGSARNMAAGISKATIPTMAGMVGALTGVFFIAMLEREAKLKRTHLADELTFDH